MYFIHLFVLPLRTSLDHQGLLHEKAYSSFNLSWARKRARSAEVGPPSSMKHRPESLAEVWRRQVSISLPEMFTLSSLRTRLDGVEEQGVKEQQETGVFKVEQSPKKT